MADADQKTLAFAVANWLQTQAGTAGDAEKLKEASKLVSDAFGIDINNAEQKAQFGKGPGLKNVWDVFMKTQAKLGSGATATPAASAPSSSQPSAEDKAKAEQLKAEGNKHMSAKDHDAAIESYTKAIELDSTNPVYFSNRSAAYAQLQQHDNAIEDAREASRVNPQFAKAYSRLGHALFDAGRFQEAVEAYEKGVEVDPSNAVMKSGLETAKQHANKPDSKSPPSSGQLRDVAGGAGADPLAGMGGFPGMGGGQGGMPDLASLMNNPMIAQMAQQMMGNGGIEQMMNNPMVQQMMQRFGCGGGSMPDVNALMQDPQMREMARNMMGGMGGQGGAGRGNGGAGRGSNNNGGSSNTGDDMFS